MFVDWDIVRLSIVSAVPCTRGVALTYKFNLAGNDDSGLPGPGSLGCMGSWYAQGRSRACFFDEQWEATKDVVQKVQMIARDVCQTRLEASWMLNIQE